MTYMPDVRVEVAFDSGYATPAASRTWTDVSDYVELADGIKIDFGRQDERSTADANSLSLTLDNSDGRFTAGRSASPYYPNVKVGRPIRVLAGQNLLPNPTFDVSTTGWTTGAGTFTTLASDVGDYVSTSAAAAFANFVYSGFTPAAPGEDFTASVYLKTQGASSNYLVSLYWYNGGALLSTTNENIPAGSLSGTVYTRIGVTGAAPSGTTQVRMQVTAASALPVGTGFRLDDAMLTKTDGLVQYGDGSQPGWEWTGTPHNSPSIMPRFVGFVDEWPVEWDGTDTYARASITAASRLSRLGLNAKLRSAIEQEVLAPGPIGYWTMGDSQGSTTAAESSGAGLIGPLRQRNVVGNTGPMIFGNAVGVASDGLSAAELFTGGDPMRVDLPSGTTVRSWRFTFLGTAYAGGDFLGWLEGAPGSGTSLVLVYDNSGSPSNNITEFGNANLSTGTVSPDVLHDLVVTSSAADGTRIYIDGVLRDTDTGKDRTNMTRLQVGYVNTLRASYTFCHVAIYDVILTPTQIASQAEAALTGFAGDRTDERVVRILGWAGVPASEVTVETGVETMNYRITTGMGVVDALREAESTEGGVLFDGRDGNVTFHNRNHRHLQTTPAVTLNMASQHVGQDYAPRVDRSALVNDVTVENPTTEETVRLVDTASADEYGPSSTTITAVTETADGFLERAQWALSSYAEPRTRTPSLTVDVLAHQGLTPSAQDLLALTIGDLIEVENAPAQSDTTTPTYFIEGGTETIGPESYEITFNVSPASPTADVLILDSTTRGLLDTNRLSY